jgi:hypothetical protein
MWHIVAGHFLVYRAKKSCPFTVVPLTFAPSSTLSDYMITIFQDRHSGMDCRNPGSVDRFELTIHGTGYPLHDGHDELEHNLTK